LFAVKDMPSKGPTMAN